MSRYDRDDIIVCPDCECRHIASQDCHGCAARRASHDAARRLAIARSQGYEAGRRNALIEQPHAHGKARARVLDEVLRLLADEMTGLNAEAAGVAGQTAKASEHAACLLPGVLHAHGIVEALRRRCGDAEVAS